MVVTFNHQRGHKILFALLPYGRSRCQAAWVYLVVLASPDAGLLCRSKFNVLDAVRCGGSVVPPHGCHGWGGGTAPLLASHIVMVASRGACVLCFALQTQDDF